MGGGFTGIAAAYTLAKAGHRVTIYEKDNQLGGLAGSFKAKKFFYIWCFQNMDLGNLNNLKLLVLYSMSIYFFQNII